MQKVWLFLCLLTSSLPALAQDEMPAALKEHYNSSLNELNEHIWLRKGQPELEYSICLNKQVAPEQRIVVMCGYMTNASEQDSAPFDIWYLDGSNIAAHTTTEGYGRMGASGDAKAVKIGEKWGVILESSYMMQGVEQTFQQFYVAHGEDIQSIASIPIHSSSEENGPPDNLDTKVAFAQQYSGTYPNMLLHSTGTLAGKKINEQWSVPFDPKTNSYLIPEEIVIGY